MWARSGQELFYMAPDGHLMVVDIELEPSFSPGPAREALEQPYFFSPRRRTYDIAPDGERFLMVKELDDERPEMVFVLNWFEELKRLVPVGHRESR